MKPNEKKIAMGIIKDVKSEFKFYKKEIDEKLSENEVLFCGVVFGLYSFVKYCGLSKMTLEDLGGFNLHQFVENINVEIEKGETK